MEYDISEIEHNKHTYWINIEFTKKGFIVFISEASKEPIEDFKIDFGEKYKVFLNGFKRYWCLTYGITAKDGGGSLFFGDKITALTNARAIIESYK